MKELPLLSINTNDACFQGKFILPCMALSSWGSSSMIGSRRKEGWSVPTNVCVSSPRAAAPFFPQGTQQVAAQRVPTQLCQSWAETLTQITLYYTLCSCEKAQGTKSIHGSPFKTQTLGTAPSFYNIGQVGDLGWEYPAPKEACPVQRAYPEPGSLVGALDTLLWTSQEKYCTRVTQSD